MMLGECNLFPHGLLPLHIFEPRYRQMLQHALENDRMFCIGTRFGPEDAADPASCIDTASTAAFIRACVAQPDGCSNLLLQGLHRITLSDFRTDLPYVTAAVTPLATDPADPEDELPALTERLRGHVLELIEGGHPVSSHVQNYLEDLEHPEVLADIVAYHFVRNPMERHPLLAEPNLLKRLGHLEQLLALRLQGKADD